MKQPSGRHIAEEMAEHGLEPKPSKSWPGLPPVLGLSGSLPQSLHYHFPAGITESLAAASSPSSQAQQDEVIKGGSLNLGPAPPRVVRSGLQAPAM